MGFLATAITMFFNPVDAILGSPGLDWPETVFDALLASTRPPPLYLTRANPTFVPIGSFLCLVVAPIVPAAYVILRLGPSRQRTFLSLAFSPFVATRLFIKHTDPFTVCLATFIFGTSLGCTLDFLFAFSNTNNIVLFSTFDILASALLSYIKTYHSMGVVTLLALFSIGWYLQRKKQTKPVETNKGDVPSERIPERDGGAGMVSNVEKTSPAVTLPFPTNSEGISQRTTPDCEEKSIVPSCRRCLSGYRQAAEDSEHIATNIEQSQDNHLVETSPTPPGSPSFLELTDSPSLVTGSDTATATKTPSVFLDICRLQYQSTSSDFAQDVRAYQSVPHAILQPSAEESSVDLLFTLFH
ncbi:uncharacterized protein ARMOST_06680 [Armillaria ostoyae]|uniref:Mannosyltransferase n=1 Tax=Armillaria ostoyae TaxID=47428 RepID=A0A284R3N7_ARMOS|nr:uncharacterized protein ARMOST_06680 [Armillaria ostoyae]